MESRQSETYHQAKDRLNAALQPFGLRVDCMMPWHYQAWDLYRKEGAAYMPVMTSNEPQRPGLLRHLMRSPAASKVSFRWNSSLEEILAWAREHGLIAAARPDATGN